MLGTPADVVFLFEHGLEIALHSLQLLNRALWYIWYCNGFKQTNKHTHTLSFLFYSFCGHWDFFEH